MVVSGICNTYSCSWQTVSMAGLQREQQPCTLPVAVWATTLYACLANATTACLRNHSPYSELCDHSSHLRTAAAVPVTFPPLLPPQVDDRLNGDGVGLPLGINDPTLAWVFVGVSGLIWTLYFIAQKDFGDFEDNDSGVGL